MRRPIITQAWLADFYAEGVKPKYKGSIKRQATSSKPQAQPEVASTKHQATSFKHQAKIDTSYKHQATSNKRLLT